MSFPYVCPGPHTLTISATGNSQTISRSEKVTSTGGAATGKPEIVTFEGPSSVSCSGGGRKSVSFQYVTKNATAVSPVVDGEPVVEPPGYDPDSGTMSFPYQCPGPHTLTIDAFADGKTASKSATVTARGGGGTSMPQILEFDGPDTASCGPASDTVTLSYDYRTKNATTVEPSIDGEPVGAQAGYDPAHGVMRFAYVCPGPHTLTITAFGANNASTTRSVDVAPSSGG